MKKKPIFLVFYIIIFLFVLFFFAKSARSFFPLIICAIIYVLSLVSKNSKAQEEKKAAQTKVVNALAARLPNTPPYKAPISHEPSKDLNRRIFGVDPSSDFIQTNGSFAQQSKFYSGSGFQEALFVANQKKKPFDPWDLPPEANPWD